MASYVVRMFTITILALLPAAMSQAFLEPRVSKEEVEQALLVELPGSSNSTQLAIFREELRPMYTSLPKNEQGQLKPSTVRYALHRYFVHKHGWYVKGLDPQGAVVGSDSSSQVMKNLAPLYLQGLFEKRLQGRGLQLEELAVLAATLSDLIFQESFGTLWEVYRKLEMPIGLAVSESQFDRAIRAYFAGLVVGDFAKFRGTRDLAELEKTAKDFYPEYDDIMMWAQDLRSSRDFVELSRRNPFVPPRISWDRAAVHLRELMHNFGTLLKDECGTLKKNLMRKEAPGTGRVLLSDFYSIKKLQMHESVDYLRNLGVLEEEGQSARLVVSNYLGSVSRCMPFSSYFSICCPDECEDIFGRLEAATGSAQAAPAHIAEVISGLSSDTKSAPWEIPTLLMERLEEIANRHQGQVPLHGRLFKQWMHHAFPAECPFPHVSGTTSPVSQDDWLEMFEDITTVDALPDEKATVISERRPGDDAGVDDLPWIEFEELVGDDKPVVLWPVLRVLMGLSALASFALAMVRASRPAMSKRADGKTHTV